jgi:hypothetical protein
MIRPMGIAVAFTDAETKGRLRQRFNISGEAGSVKTGREGTRLARFPQAKTATGKGGTKVSFWPVPHPTIGLLLKWATAIPGG